MVIRVLRRNSFSIYIKLLKKRSLS